MHPTRCLDYRPSRSPWLVKLSVSVISVGLQDAGVPSQMCLGMLAFSIAGITEYRRRRSRSTKRSVITKINPATRDIGFSDGQDRNGRIVRMKPFSRHDVSLDQAPERVENMADGPHRVGHRRQRDRHAFQGVTFRLAVQWLMLSEFLKHDHREEAGASPSPGHDMEWRWRLCDLLTVTAGEFLPHRLDHLPLARL